MIDWHRVASLRAEIGAEDFLEVAEMFLDEAEEVIARMRAAIEPGQAPGPGLEADLHFLKGSALNLGFSDLANMCNEGERAASAGKPVDVNRVIQCYSGSRAAFEGGIAACSSAA